MKLLVCGGRDYQDFKKVNATLDELRANHNIELVIHGAAAGADRLAGEWAFTHGIHAAMVPALWDHYGMGAGPRRNEAMLLLRPDMVLAFPGGRGTANMVKKAKAIGIPVMIVNVDQQGEKDEHI